MGHWFSIQSYNLNCSRRVNRLSKTSRVNPVSNFFSLVTSSHQSIRFGLLVILSMYPNPKALNLKREALILMPGWPIPAPLPLVLGSCQSYLLPIWWPLVSRFCNIYTYICYIGVFTSPFCMKRSNYSPAGQQKQGAFALMENF